MASKLEQASTALTYFVIYGGLTFCVLYSITDLYYSPCRADADAQVAAVKASDCPVVLKGGCGKPPGEDYFAFFPKLEDCSEAVKNVTLLAGSLAKNTAVASLGTAKKVVGGLSFLAGSFGCFRHRKKIVEGVNPLSNSTQQVVSAPAAATETELTQRLLVEDDRSSELVPAPDRKDRDSGVGLKLF